MPAEEAIAALGGKLVRLASGQPHLPEAESMLVRADRQGCYPVIGGIPVLLAPEMLVPPTCVRPIDVSHDPYREAYEEMKFYDDVAERESGSLQDSEPFHMVKAVVDKKLSPKSAGGWLDATYDARAQLDAYAYLAPMEGLSSLQLGGRGIHAVKFLIAGASESWLVTPMLNEATFAMRLAQAFGVDQRLRCVVAIGEELPFGDASFDRIYTGGCLHHTVTSRSLAEIARLLVKDGRFAAVEPWRAPLYAVGTKVLGKREVGVNCRPLDKKRIEPLFVSFAAPRVIHHGAMTRYPLLALNKFGLTLGSGTISKITAIDDTVSSLCGPLRRSGSSVAILAAKT